MADDEQLDLVTGRRSSRRSRPPRPPQEAAAERSVARVVIDSPLAHLDRVFDYRVPAELDAQVVPGCRVKVRFAGRLTQAFVVGRSDETEHEGTLAFVTSVVSSEPVLSAAVLGLSRSVADRWAGTLSDVLRLAIPARHAAAEARPGQVASSPDASWSADVWDPWPSGPDLVRALADGSSPRAVLSCLPDRDPAELVAHAVLATLDSGRGAIVCVPDARDVDRWHAVFSRVLGEGRHVVLTAGLKPAQRYAAFLAAARSQVKVVLGTRSAAFAPVADLGLLVQWDDGDDLYAEPRAPYFHTREVLLLRARQESAGLLLAGYARSVEAQSLVESGWCVDLSAQAPTRRMGWPQVTVTDGSDGGGAPARLPRQVFDVIRASDGATLVQVPRRGYRASLACQDCRTPARCDVCSGPLAQRGAGQPIACRWCGAAAPRPWTCVECGGHRLRAPTIGQLRTAEEYGQAFPEHWIVTSGGSSVQSEVAPGRTIVLATPGAEPRVEGGYHAVVLMDTWLMTSRDDTRVVEEAHRRWFNALALARPRAPAVAVGDPASLQALVRADPVGVATRELAEREATHLPPVARLAVLDGPEDVVEPLASRSWTPTTEVLGPVPLEGRGVDPGTVRLVLRAPRREGAELSFQLHQVQAEWSAAKLPPVRVQVDPLAF